MALGQPPCVADFDVDADVRLGAGPMTISPIYNSQLYILRYTTKAKVKNEPFCQTRKINIRIKFYLFCRTHAFEHHRYIVEFYITKLSIQCSLPMWWLRVLPYIDRVTS